jgi:hypothetical protein
MNKRNFFVSKTNRIKCEPQSDCNPPSLQSEQLGEIWMASLSRTLRWVYSNQQESSHEFRRSFKGRTQVSQERQTEQLAGRKEFAVMDKTTFDPGLPRRSSTLTNACPSGQPLRLSSSCDRTCLLRPSSWRFHHRHTQAH